MRHLLLVALVILPQFVWAETTAEEVVKRTIQDAKELVEADQGKSGEAVLRKKLEGVIFPIFDFEEMSKRSLGPSWNEASKDERSEYVRLFSELISRTYYKKVINNIADSEISFKGADGDASKALVKTFIKSKEGDVDVNYRLRNQDQSWRVYDIVVANVSLVSNYRSEFGGIVRREKMAGLLQKLREKI